MMSVISVVMKARSLQIADQDAIDGAEQRAADDGRRDRRAATGQFEHVERVERAEVGQREHRSDREVDAADDDDQRLPSPMKPISPACRAVSARLDGGQEVVDRSGSARSRRAAER